MKKALFFLFLIATQIVAVKAQFSENFNNTENGQMPANWTLFNVDGLTPHSESEANWINNAWCCAVFGNFSTKAAWSTSFYEEPGQTDDWMFTPAITVPNNNPVLRYEVASYSDYYMDSYEVRIMTTAPTIDNINTSTVLLSINDASSSPTTAIIDLNIYAGQTVYIAWRNNSKNKYALGIDNVCVTTQNELDAELTSLDLPQYVYTPGNMTIKGLMTNVGTQNITSFDVIYKIGGGAESPICSISSINIIPGATKEFTHNIPANLIAGDHSIEVKIVAVNNTTDNNMNNNSYTDIVHVASQLVSKECLFESFSSATCTPCAPWNETFQSWIHNHDTDNINYIKYQMWFPYGGDPYFIPLGKERFNYYALDGIRATIANGQALSSQMATTLDAVLNQSNIEKSTFSINATFSYIDKEISLPFTITPFMTISDVNVHVAICEKTTTGNVVPVGQYGNGETEFHHVLMYMWYSSDNESVNFTINTPYINTVNYNMASTHVEEMEDLIAVIFLQDKKTKNVLQSNTFEIQSVGIENKDKCEIAVYPNPSMDYFKITNARQSDIFIYNMWGQCVKSEKNISNDYLISTENMPNGMYLLKVLYNNKMVTSVKISVVK